MHPFALWALAAAWLHAAEAARVLVEGSAEHVGQSTPATAKYPPAPRPASPPRAAGPPVAPVEADENDDWEEITLDMAEPEVADAGGGGGRLALYTCRIDEEELTVKVRDVHDHVGRQLYINERNHLRWLRGQDGSDFIVSLRASAQVTTDAGPRGLIFQERADFTLQDVLEERRALVPEGGAGSRDSVIFSLAFDILRGVQAIVKSNSFHGDIAPWNIYIFGDWRHGFCRAKVGNFAHAGEARAVFLEPNVRRYEGDESGLPYAAPELMLGEGVRAGIGMQQADLWSVGIVLTELFAGSLPEGWADRVTRHGWSYGYEENLQLLREHIFQKVSGTVARTLLYRFLIPSVGTQRTEIGAAVRHAGVLLGRSVDGTKEEDFPGSWFSWARQSTTPRPTPSREDIWKVVQTGLPVDWMNLE